MARTHFSSNASGYTLIEVLIALAIFSIGLMALGLLQSQSLLMTGDAARKTEAWAILDDQVAQLKQLPFYTNTAAQTFSPGLDDTGGGWATTDPSPVSPRYAIHLMVEDDQPIGPQNATMFSSIPAGIYTVSKRITVTVTFAGGDPDTDPLAQTQFIKTWAATGIQ